MVLNSWSKSVAMDRHILKGSGKLSPSSLHWYLCQLCIRCRANEVTSLLSSSMLPSRQQDGLGRWQRGGRIRGVGAGCLCSAQAGADPALEEAKSKCWPLL